MQGQSPEGSLQLEGFPPSLSGPSEKSGGGVGRCGAPSITNINEPGGVSEVKDKEQKAAVG